jgi:hypothetical protein
MKFTKLAKSDKFEYMTLSRLIQDAKYFIDHSDLKHLWARTLDEHIKQMKEQYAKLDPKPEWTSEDEINDLAKQMKESYTNHWNEVHPDNKIEAAIQQPNKPKPTTMLPDNMQWAWDPEAADWVAVLKDNTNTTPPLYDPNNQNLVNQNTTSYMSTVKSACLSKFLDGPQYSKEIKIEAGLIKEGLLKYAGFDFNRGTKYAITTKGLEVLRKASEAEHNEALNEREKLEYLFGFNTDEVSTLDTTGKVLKQATSKKWTICEADGTELGEVEADNELDAKVKFGIEHPEYADSQSICVKEIKSGLEYSGAFEYNDYKIDLFNDTDGGATFVIYAPKGKTVNHESMYKGTASTMDEAITKAYKIIDGSKEIDAKYEETTESHEPYPNPSETPHDDIVLENHDGWVNTASFEDDIRKQFQQPHQKLPNSDRDLALLEKQILEITDEDTRDTVRKIFDEFQFSDKEAAEKRPYTEEEKRMLPLFRLLNEHVAKKEIQLEEDPQKDGNIVATGQAEVINDLEHEVKDLGFHCEPIAEITDNDYIGYDIYSLRIFYK